MHTRGTFQRSIALTCLCDANDYIYLLRLRIVYHAVMEVINFNVKMNGNLKLMQFTYSIDIIVLM